MKLLNHDAIHVLFEHAKYLNSQPHDLWRCIYFNLSSKEAQCREELRTHFVVEYLEDVLDPMDGEIYVCDDGDIFILFSGPLRPIVHKLGRRFKDLEPEHLGDQPKDKLFTIFDLSKYWLLFYTLCTAKHQQIKEALETQYVYFPAMPDIVEYCI